MALGDGITWDETVPTDATLAVQIDDYNRDLRKGIRGRMALEHEWPASQSVTSEAGAHKFITLQEQGTKPTLSGTQKAAVYAKTDGNFYFEKSDGTEVTVVSGTAVGDGKILANGTDANASYLEDKINTTHLAMSGTAVTLQATGVFAYYDYNTGLSSSTRKDTTALIICKGQASFGGTSEITISNLPFSSINSYNLVAVRSGAAYASQAISQQRQSGSDCKLRDFTTGASCDWIAVGH